LKVLGGYRKHTKVLFVDMFLPLEEHLGQIDTMEIDESELDSSHSVFIMGNSLAPFLPSSVDNILMSLEAVFK
jgi:hypothetical protein